MNMILSYLAFQSLDYEHTGWRLFQKRVVQIKLDIYVSYHNSNVKVRVSNDNETTRLAYESANPYDISADCRYIPVNVNISP